MPARIIPIIIREAITKAGRKFTAYKAIVEGGKLIDCTFTSAVNKALIPTADAFVAVPTGKANINHKGQYPKLYVEEIAKTSPMSAEAKAKLLPKKESLQDRENDLDENFGAAVADDDFEKHLPF